ncbi:MAG: nuclear transport factor 2 family protein [Rhodanobacteraceae bacterium]
METNGRWIDELFAAIDRKDHQAFAAFLAPGACFRFGNHPPVRGRAAIAEATAQFFAAVRALNHRIEERWLLPDTAIVTGAVTYTRHDGSTLDVPFANVLRFGENAVDDYRVFVDDSALLSP